MKDVIDIVNDHDINFTLFAEACVNLIYDKKMHTLGKAEFWEYKH